MFQCVSRACLGEMLVSKTGSKLRQNKRRGGGGGGGGGRPGGPRIQEGTQGMQCRQRTQPEIMVTGSKQSPKPVVAAPVSNCPWLN
jgi:hypothetical protein